jgi:uncharacterized membrane protein
MKCEDCGIAPVPAIYRVGSGLLALALLTGSAIGAVAGAVALSILYPYPLLLILLGLVVGAVAAEGVSRVARGRQGPVIAIAASSSSVIGLALVAPNVLAVLHGESVIPVGHLLLGLVQRPFYLLFVAVAAFSAFWRLR